MAKFVTRIFPKAGGNKTDCKTVGMEIEKLSKRKGSIGGAISSSGSIPQNWKNWSNPERVIAEKIIRSLSVNLVDTGAVVGPLSPLDPIEQIDDHVKVRFVFEEEGDLVIVIPNEATIPKNVNDMPLENGRVYNQFSRRKVMESVQQEFDTRIEDGSTVPGLSISQKDKIKDLFEELYKKPPQSGARHPTFYTQLGEYSCRQCGH